jgi:hypothetical protein
MNMTEPALRDLGFVGWTPLATLRPGDCPSSGGIYVVAYGAGNPASFPEVSCGGWFKGKDPAVSQDDLVANWVPDASVVYIGKADNLRRRLREFADFGAGKPVGHRGGRLIWQLPDTSALSIAWKETPGRSPLEAEAELLSMFRVTYGKPPFANAPHMRGR